MVRESPSANGSVPVLMMARELGWGGGIERDVSKFARHLSKHGIAPHVACFRPGGKRWSEIEAAGVPVLAVPLNSFKSRSAIDAAKVLRAYANERRIRVLHAFDTATDLFGVPLARLSGISVVLSSQLWLRDILRPSERISLSIIDKVATGLFVNCNAVADDLVARWRVPRNRVHVCHNGFEPEEFNARGRCRPDALADASVVVGTVAVLREEKNIPLLIEAFARVCKIDPRARLLIVGNGVMEPALRAQAQNLGISNCCIFEDATPQPAKWMRAIDIFVLPSTSECFSNALLEAMACGCCPVGSRVGGTPELIAHGERGLLFESGQVEELSEALCLLTQNSGLRKRMADAATRFVHDYFTIDIAASRLASIYKNLLNRNGHAAPSNITNAWPRALGAK